MLQAAVGADFLPPGEAIVPPPLLVLSSVSSPSARASALPCRPALMLQRNKICDVHIKAVVFLRDGQQLRFCQVGSGCFCQRGSGGCFRQLGSGVLSKGRRRGWKGLGVGSFLLLLPCCGTVTPAGSGATGHAGRLLTACLVYPSIVLQLGTQRACTSPRQWEIVSGHRSHCPTQVYQSCFVLCC